MIDGLLIVDWEGFFSIINQQSSIINLGSAATAMIDIKIKIDDKQIMDFCKKSPKRAQWAMSEALKMAGGHFRKRLRAYIERGGENWPPLSESTKKIKRHKGQFRRTPLYVLGRFVRFKYSKRRGKQQVNLGFLDAGLRRVARLVDYGGTKRVSDNMRKFYHKMGIHLQKDTRLVVVPARPIIKPFWRRYSKEADSYVEKRFFEKFFSKEKKHSY